MSKKNLKNLSNGIDITFSGDIGHGKKRSLLCRNVESWEIKDGFLMVKHPPTEVLAGATCFNLSFILYFEPIFYDPDEVNKAPTALGDIKGDKHSTS